MKYTAESPYGYWISKTDVIPVIHEESHAEVALEKVLGRSGKAYSVYAIMFRLGYVRVVNFDDGTYGVELWGKHKPSKLQREFVLDAAFVDYASGKDSPLLYEGLL